MSSTVTEPTMIGLTEKTHTGLKRLKDDEHFNQMADGYRFGIALALASGVIPDEIQGAGTIFSVATIDPNREIYTAIKSLITTGDMPVYRWAERLAEWGVTELIRRAEAGEIDFASIFKQVEEGIQG
ncbi:MAG: hypothetical protein ABSH53_14670 [Holophaga sp.]